jgi:hypothetical protein
MIQAQMATSRANVAALLERVAVELSAATVAVGDAREAANAARLKARSFTARAAEAKAASTAAIHYAKRKAEYDDVLARYTAASVSLQAQSISVDAASPLSRKYSAALAAAERKRTRAIAAAADARSWTRLSSDRINAEEVVAAEAARAAALNRVGGRQSANGRKWAVEPSEKVYENKMVQILRRAERTSADAEAKFRTACAEADEAFNQAHLSAQIAYEAGAKSSLKRRVSSRKQ